MWPVLPIVLYTGEREWGSPGSLAELTSAPEELTGFQPLFGSVFFGVRQGSLEALTRGKDPLGWLLRLFRLERASAKEFATAVQEAFERMESLVAAGETERWLRMAWFVVGFIRYRRPAEEAEELLSAARRAVGDPTRGQEVEDMGKTSAEVLEEKGQEKGRAEGEAKGKRETLLGLMRRKFGVLPGDVERRIEALAEVSRIDELLDRILSAATIEEMGA